MLPPIWWIGCDESWPWCNPRANASKRRGEEEAAITNKQSSPLTPAPCLKPRIIHPRPLPYTSHTPHTGRFPSPSAGCLCPVPARPCYLLACCRLPPPPPLLLTHTYTMSARLMQFVNSPTGPKTTHFWGPVANWGFVLAVRYGGREGGREGGGRERGRGGEEAGRLLTRHAYAYTQAIIDSKKPPETISAKMTGGTYLHVWGCEDLCALLPSLAFPSNLALSPPPPSLPLVHSFGRLPFLQKPMRKYFDASLLSFMLLLRSHPPLAPSLPLSLPPSLSPFRLQSDVHAIRLDGAATQLPPLGLPCFQ